MWGVLLRPRRWGIATRAAVVSGLVVLSALCVVGLSFLWTMLVSYLGAPDEAASSRVREIAGGLQADGLAGLDAALLDTDSHIVLVQIVDESGAVVARSAAAPVDPLVPVTYFGPELLETALRDDVSPNDDMRLNGRQVETRDGDVTVIVGGGSAAVEFGIWVTGILLAFASAVVTAVAAAVSYTLVRRSLHSVEAIRAQVADITAAGLGERVPVPERHDEISRLAETMNSMLERVEAGNRVQRQFVGDASHELRSPLATIISALEVADAHPDLLNQKMATGMLLPEARRMRVMIDDLLLLARADKHALPLPDAVVEMHDVVADEAARLRYTTAITIRSTITPASVIGDRDALVRMVRNLLDNAVRHTTSLIELSVHEKAGSAELFIADDGPGIAVADRARVFDRFVRLDSDRSRRGGGTGLGLAIVAEIVTNHGGGIEISERPGGGALVTVTIPCSLPCA